MVKIFSLLVFHLVVVSKLLWCTLNNALHVIKMHSGKSLSKFAEDLSIFLQSIEYLSVHPSIYVIVIT